MTSIRRAQQRLMGGGFMKIVLTRTHLSWSRSQWPVHDYGTCCQLLPETLRSTSRKQIGLPWMGPTIYGKLHICMFSSQPTRAQHLPVWVVAALKRIGKSPKNVTEEFVDEMKQQMEYLEGLGCKRYQILESPQVLEYPKDNIAECCTKLQNCGIKEVSIPLLAIALKTPQVRLQAAVSAYRGKLQDYVSVADFWRQMLNRTEDEMECLMTSNPRLMKSNKYIKEKMLKLDLLLENGLTRSHVAKCSHVLTNQTFTTLQARIKQLQDVHIQPIPIAAITQAGYLYEQRLASLIASQEEAAERWQHLSTLLGHPAEHLKKFPVLRNTSLSSLEERISFLMSERNYTSEDILACPGILHRKSIDRLKETFFQLDELGLEQLPLASVVSFAVYKKIPMTQKNGSLKSLLKILECEEWRLPEIDAVQYTALFSQRPSVIRQNLRFLTEECNFTWDVVLDLPIILGHAHKVVVRQWEKLCCDKDDITNKLQKEPSKVLNCLQYYIEREANFKHPVLTQDHDQIDQ